MLGSVGVDPQRVFLRPASKLHSPLSPDGANGTGATSKQPEQPGVAELIGDDTRVLVRNVDEFLFPLIRADLVEGSLETFRLYVTRGKLHANVLDALADNLPSTIRSWGKYQPDLVNSSRFEVIGVRYQTGNFPHVEWKEFSISALRVQPDIMQEAREVAASSGQVLVHFRIKSTPLTIMIGDQDFRSSTTTVDMLERKRGNVAVQSESEVSKRRRLETNSKQVIGQNRAKRKSPGMETPNTVTNSGSKKQRREG